MRLTRELRGSGLIVATVAAAALSGALGCARRVPPKPDVMVDPLIVEDAAMKHRPWDTSVALYPNGATLAGPTQFYYEPKRGQAEWAYYYADSLTFLLNTALLPVNLVVTPQWMEVIYPGAVIPPTFSGMPAPQQTSDAQLVRATWPLPTNPPPAPQQAAPAQTPPRSATPRVVVPPAAPAAVAPAHSATPSVKVLTQPGPGTQP